jgi:uncharacterized protein DUF4129
LRRILAILVWPVLALGLCLICVAQTPPDPSPSVTLDEYITALDGLDSTIKSLDGKNPDTSELLQKIPSAWRVKTGQQTFEVSSEWLRNELFEWKNHPDEKARNLITKRLEHLRSEAAGFALPVSDASDKQAQLNHILSAQEFHNVHGPTWMDRLKQRLVELLIRLLGRTLGSSVIPAIGNVVVYGLIAAAVLLLAYWMYRSIKNSGELETILPHPLPISSKEWTLWMAEARAAADRGNWRDAIHLGYWCGVSFLEAQGLWRPDYARTPREYLRLLPTSSEHHPTLLALTRSFEIVWYGKQEADAAAFSQTLSQLEKLGCH